MADMKRIGGNVRKVYKWNDAPSERPLHSTKAPSAQPVRRRSAKRSNTAALLQWILIAFVVCVMVLLSIFAISLKTSEIELSRLEKECALNQQKVINAQDELDYAKSEENLLANAKNMKFMYPQEDGMNQKTIALPARSAEGALASK